MDQLNPETIILNTGVLDTNKLTIRASKEITESPLNALSVKKKNNEAIVGIVGGGL